jgi:glycosyltransferase involved in cell wall biosynthesis
MEIEQPELSLVIPLYNEEESLRELKKWIDTVLKGRAYEVIFVDDGSRDGSWRVIEELAGSDPQRVVGLKMARNYGKSAGLHVGFQAAQGKVVITMDADLQDSPEEIPELERKIREDGFDMVSGWKKKRHDPLSKTIPTRLYNAATRLVSGIDLNDFNCGLKAYRLEVVKAVEVQGEMHRYIPILAKKRRI